MTAKIVPERAGLSGIHTRDVHYEYDLRGLQTKARFDGISGEGLTNVWDGFGRLVSTATNLGGFNRIVYHQYDRDGAEVEILFPDEHKFWTRRDGLGRMALSYHGPLGDPATPMAEFHYDAAAQLHRIGRRWGSATNLGYDPAGRLSTLEHGFASGPGHSVSTFAYNPAGRLRRNCEISHRLGQYCGRGRSLVGVAPTAESRPGRES